MGARKSPDLSPGALCHLVAGMTADEVETVIGRSIRPNLHEGRRYYAWIGIGAMLRAFFDGPDNTLSAQVLGHMRRTEAFGLEMGKHPPGAPTTAQFTEHGSA